MFSWFDAKDSKDFANTLADFIIEKMPREAGDRNKILSKKKHVLDRALLQVHAFKKAHTLNIYKKAQLGNTFKWRLRTANYDNEFIDELTNIILIQL